MKSVFYFEKAKMKSTEMKSTLILFVHFNIIFGGFVFIGLFIDWSNIWTIKKEF